MAALGSDVYAHAPDAPRLHAAKVGENEFDNAYSDGNILHSSFA